MSSVENIRSKISLDVIVIGAGIGGLAAAMVGIRMSKKKIYRNRRMLIYTISMNS